MAAWLRDGLGLEDVAGAAERADVDGATAAEMDPAMWQALGAPPLMSARIVGKLKNLS